jgi:general secretion pathway protein B
VSYILDALEKSEAERNRGVVPSLFANRQDQLKSRVGLWVLFVALLINACLGGYWLYSRNNTAPPEPSVVATPQTPPTPSRSIASQQPAQEQTPAITAPTAPASIPATTTSASIPAATTAASAAVPRPAGHARPTSNEMELANLSFSTHIYASDPTKRAVTLNGRRLVEGDSISNGTVLKEITETGVILEVNGREVPLDVLQDWR